MLAVSRDTLPSILIVLAFNLPKHSTAYRATARKASLLSSLLYTQFTILSTGKSIFSNKINKTFKHYVLLYHVLLLV